MTSLQQEGVFKSKQTTISFNILFFNQFLCRFLHEDTSAHLNQRSSGTEPNVLIYFTSIGLLPIIPFALLSLNSSAAPAQTEKRRDRSQGTRLDG